MSELKLNDAQVPLYSHFRSEIEPVQSKILQLSSSILTQIGPPVFKLLNSFVSEVDDLKNQVNFKYTREGVDQNIAYDLKPGSIHIQQLNLLKGMIEAVSSATIREGPEKLKALNQCIGRSEKFFYLEILLNIGLAFAEMREELINECKNLNEDESFIFPTGPLGHAVLFHITKHEGKLYIRLYNTGMGCEEKDGSACMPLFEIDLAKTDLSSLFREILSLRTKKDKSYNATVEKIIKNYGGQRIHKKDELHDLQDRGNCTWKCLSTFFADCVKGLTVSPNDPIFKKLPQEVQDKLGKEPIAYNRLVKIVDYEVLRSKAKKISIVGISNIKQKQTQQDVSWQMRLHAFVNQNVMERYEKKDNPASLASLLDFLDTHKDIPTIKDDEKLENLLNYAPIQWRDPEVQRSLSTEFEKLKSKDSKLLADFFEILNKNTLNEIVVYAEQATFDESFPPNFIKKIATNPEQQRYFLDLCYRLCPEKKDAFIDFFLYMDGCIRCASDMVAGTQTESIDEYYKNTQAFKTFGFRLKFQFMNSFNNKYKLLICDILKKKTEQELTKYYQKQPSLIYTIDQFLNRVSRYDEFAEYADLHKQLTKLTSQ